MLIMYITFPSIRNSKSIFDKSQIVTSFFQTQTGMCFIPLVYIHFSFWFQPIDCTLFPDFKKWHLLYLLKFLALYNLLLQWFLEYSQLFQMRHLLDSSHEQTWLLYNWKNWFQISEIIERDYEMMWVTPKSHFSVSQLQNVRKSHIF